jgi:hypothetical protein
MPQKGFSGTFFNALKGVSQGLFANRSPIEQGVGEFTLFTLGWPVN